ncbi:MAG: YIP1 family protein [Verrucomicrobiota bacterium]
MPSSLESKSRQLTSLAHSLEAAAVRLGFFGPFFRMWVQPREMTRRLIENDRAAHTHLMAGLIGAAMALSGPLLSTPLHADVVIAMLVIGMVLGVAIGIGRLYLESAFMMLVGWWCDGRGSYSDLRCATAWTYGPEIAFHLCIIPVVASTNPNFDWPWIQQNADWFGAAAAVLIGWRVIVQVRASLAAHGLFGASGSLTRSRRLATGALVIASGLFFWLFLQYVQRPILVMVFQFGAAAESG